MDEEMNQSGAKVYASRIGQKEETHYLAIESDAGGFSPKGFSIDAEDSIVSSIANFKEYLLPYGVYNFFKGYPGTDINFLKQYHIPLIGLITNDQKYFDYHHSASDRIEAVNQRELQLGTAAIASLVYLIDKYGIDK